MSEVSSKPPLSQRIEVCWPGHDQIVLEYASDTHRVTRLSVKACLETVEAINSLKQKFKDHSVFEWPLPMGSGHSEMLIRELLLRVRGDWEFPYKKEELCHCRSVSSREVDQAILAGSHTTPEVSLVTGAASACSSCAVYIDEILRYRLGGK